MTFIKTELPNWTISVFLKALFDEGRNIHPDVTKIGIHRYTLSTSSIQSCIFQFLGGVDSRKGGKEGVRR